MRPLRIRWLGAVPYREAWALQRALHDRPGSASGVPPGDHLLLLEHPHTYTLGRSADETNVLIDPGSVGADLVEVDRGGDVTYHGPGQLVAYPIVTLDQNLGEAAGGALPHVKDYVRLLEGALIDAVRALGLAGAGRHDGYPGVWADPNTPTARKVAQIGVRVERGRTLHGIALNVDPDMSYFDHIVPCGIEDYGVTSLAAEGLDVTMRQAVDAFAAAFAAQWLARPGVSVDSVERSDVVWRAPRSGARLGK